MVAPLFTSSSVGCSFALLALVLTPLGHAEPVDRASDDALLKWNELAELPDPHGFAGPIVGVASGAVVAAGGTNFPDGRPWNGATKVWHDRIFVLRDPAGKWTERKQRLPRPLAHAVSLTIPEGILVIGGGDASEHFRQVFLLQLEGNNVSLMPLEPLPRPLALACGAVVGRTVYVAGGIIEPSAAETSQAFLALDLDAPVGRRVWQKLESWPGPGRMLAVAAAHEEAFYLFSGVDLRRSSAGDSERIYLTDAYRFAPSSGWRRLSDLPRPAAAAATPAPILGNADVLLLGGDTGEFAKRVAEIKDFHPGFSRDILAYRPIADTWAKRGKLPRELGPDRANHPNDGVWPPAVTGAVWWKERLVLPTGEVRPGVRTPRVLAATTSQPN